MKAHIPALILAGLLSACGNSSSAPERSVSLALPEGAIPVAGDETCPPPQCFEMDIPLPNDVQVSENRVRVIVPQDYTGSELEYPVLYLLHDAPGDYLSWTQLGGVYEAVKNLPVITIMPDGGGGNPGWYSDWEDGSHHWESYHIWVMMPYLESRLRIKGQGHRAIAGPSMGGFGSMSYSAKYPGMFEAAGGISGAVDFLHLEQISALYTYLGNPVAGTPNGPVWGDPVTQYDVWQRHDPGTHVAGLADMKIFLSSGNGMLGGPHEQYETPELYAIEPLILLMNQSFASALSDAGVEHETWFYGPGFHDWPYYRDAFAWMLPGLLAEIGVAVN